MNNRNVDGIARGIVNMIKGVRKSLKLFSKQEIAFLERIAREVAESDSFEVESISFTEDRLKSNIDLVYKCDASDASDLAELKKYAYEVLPIHDLFDVIDYMFNHDFEAKFRNSISFNLAAFRARCEEQFKDWTVAEMQEFIDSIEITITFDIDPCAEKVVEFIHEIVSGLNSNLTIEDLEIPEVVEAIRNHRQILFASNVDSLVRSYIECTFNDSLSRDFVRSTIGSDVAESYFSVEEFVSILDEYDMIDDYLLYVSESTVDSLVHKSSNGYFIVDRD